MFDETPPPPISQNFPVRVVASYLTGRVSAQATLVREVAEQLAPLDTYNYLKGTEKLTDEQIDLLLKFELLRQENFRIGKLPHLMELYDAVTLNSPGTFETLADRIKSKTDTLQALFPKGIPVATFDIEVYRKQAMPMKDLVFLLEHGQTMQLVLQEFNKTPGLRAMPNSLTNTVRRKVGDEEERANSILPHTATDIANMQEEVVKSPLFDFAKHIISMARTYGFGILPAKISLIKKADVFSKKEDDALTISCSKFAAEELVRYLESLRSAMGMGSRMASLTTRIEPQPNPDELRTPPVLLHIRGSALTDPQFLLKMRQSINNKAREAGGGVSI